MSPATRVAVLGPVEVATADGRTVTLPGATSRALLAALAITAPQRRSIDALADDLWGDDPPRNRRGSLQTLVSRVRAAAGTDLIRSEVDGYSLSVETDLKSAASLRTDAEQQEDTDPGRLAVLDAALMLWRGEPGADLGHAPVATELSGIASALRDRIETMRARTLVAAGRPVEALGALASHAEAHPYDDAAHHDLMTALAAADRPQEALSVFAALRKRLREDLGADPGGAASALNMKILRGEQVTGATRVRIGLRAETNTLIGRERELREVESALAASRLVTLLGAGGLGKTRLAQSLAASSAMPVVAVVPLSSIRADDDLEPAIGSALGISEARAGGRLSDARAQPDLRSRIVALLSEHPTLLVLDNCEQIVLGVAEWITEMLTSVPTLRILTTSRTPIAVAGEVVHPVRALPTDGDQAGEPGAAVNLFLERAQAVRPDAVLDGASVIRLCDRLDGLPLAIELAAARVRTMTAQQIEQRLSDRFALLRGSDRTAPERHRTLEAVIEWSWDLLDPTARHALAALSLLPAGFSASTAASVLGTAHADDLLDRLVAQSLLVVVDDPLTSGIRFRMLETVREFGIARLAVSGTETEAWDAVIAWAASLAHRQGASLFGEGSPLRSDVFREIRAEHDNLVAALRYAIAEDRASDVLFIATTLVQTWIVRGMFTELVGFAPAILDAIRDLPDDVVPADTLFTVLLPCALFSLLTGGTSGLRPLVRLRMLRRRSPGRFSPTWNALATLGEASARPDRMRVALAEFRTDADPSVRLVAELLSSQLAENDGDAVTARASARRGWELAQRAGQPWLASMAASSSAQLASQSADAAQTILWFERARGGFEEFGADDELRQLEWTIAGSLASLGRLDEAAAIFERLVSLGELTRDGLEFAATGWLGLAEVERARGNAHSAVDAYERAFLRFRSVDQRASPWYIIALAAFVSAGALDQSLPDDALARWARRLRGRVLAVERIRPDFADKPILGAALLGWSVWAIAFPELRERAVEAHALAEVLGARQNLPSLHISTHRVRIVEIVGPEAVETARLAASTLTLEERTSRAFVVLGERSR